MGTRMKDYARRTLEKAVREYVFQHARNPKARQQYLADLKAKCKGAEKLGLTAEEVDKAVMEELGKYYPALGGDD